MPVFSTYYFHNPLGQKDLDFQSFISCDWVIESLALSSHPGANGNSSGQAVFQGHWESLKQEAGGTVMAFKAVALLNRVCINSG